MATELCDSPAWVPLKKAVQAGNLNQVSSLTRTTTYPSEYLNQLFLLTENAEIRIQLIISGATNYDPVELLTKTNYETIYAYLLWNPERRLTQEEAKSVLFIWIQKPDLVGELCELLSTQTFTQEVLSQALEMASDQRIRYLLVNAGANGVDLTRPLQDYYLASMLVLRNEYTQPQLEEALLNFITPIEHTIHVTHFPTGQETTKQDQIDQAVKIILLRGDYSQDFLNVALLKAARYGQIDIFQQLIQKGANDYSGVRLVIGERPTSEQQEILHYLQLPNCTF